MNKAIELKTSRGSGAETMKSLLEELRGEDAGMETWLVDAALAGEALASDPSSREERERAARAWRAMSSILAHHLTSEDETVLPWADLQRGVPHALIERTQRQHRKLRELATVVAAVSFENGPNDRVIKAGQALCDFAICLDDLIAGEQCDLFPTLRRILFRPNRK